MSFESMIKSHDETALEAIASKGLLRRAQRDLSKGLGQIDSLDNDQATVSVDRDTIVIIAKGPQASTCTCKARGVCRHILVAVLLLRDQIDHQPSESDGTTDNIRVDETALQQISALSDALIKKFAGADMTRAMKLLADDLAPVFEDQGINLTVRLEELGASVTFIAGNDLKGAAYKGAKTKKRLLVTVAALLARQRQGAALPKLSEEALAVGISAKFIDAAQLTIERAVSATLPSRSALARDLFLDLAISSRCEALPRLSGELRGLAEQTQLAMDRSIEFDANAFLTDASRCYALLEALRTLPADLHLVGSAKRDYRETDALEIWPLGVSRWHTTTNARGLTGYCLAPDLKKWVEVRDGRRAGADMNFNVATAYDNAMWGVGSLQSLMGQRVWLSHPRVAFDGSLSTQSQGKEDESYKQTLAVNELMTCEALHKNWPALKQDLSSRMGIGIRRQPMAAPALIAPAGFGRIGFDEMSQSYHWEIFDENNDSLILKMSAKDERTALRLWKLGKSIMALVVEAQPTEQGLEFRPVSVMQNRKKSLEVFNLDFDRWPVQRGFKKLFSKFTEMTAKPLSIGSMIKDPLDQTITDTIEELVAIAGGSSSDKIESVVRRLEACGLTSLAITLQQAAQNQDLPSILRSCYLAGEVKAIHVSR